MSQNTALLLQGPDERSSEMEDVRIALGILHERGYSVERLNVPPQVLITATPISLEPHLAATNKALAEKTAECVKLQEQAERKMTYPDAMSLCAMLSGIVATIAWCGHPVFAFALPLGCSFISIILKRRA